MKRIWIMAMILCLLLSGCAAITGGSYVHEVPHQIQCLTGRGMVNLEIAEEKDVLRALDTLLKNPVAEESAQPEYGYASWRYHIGGDEHEA